MPDFHDFVFDSLPPEEISKQKLLPILKKIFENNQLNKKLCLASVLESAQVISEVNSADILQTAVFHPASESKLGILRVPDLDQFLLQGKEILSRDLRTKTILSLANFSEVALYQLRLLGYTGFLLESGGNFDPSKCQYFCEILTDLEANGIIQIGDRRNLDDVAKLDCPYIAVSDRLGAESLLTIPSTRTLLIHLSSLEHVEVFGSLPHRFGFIANHSTLNLKDKG